MPSLPLINRRQTKRVKLLMLDFFVNYVPLPPYDKCDVPLS